jgi:hypothetical protein
MSERLTWYPDEEDVPCFGDPNGTFTLGGPVAFKLAAYEDIGPPEQLAALKQENERLVRELAQLAIESVTREKTLAKLEADVAHWAKAEAEGRLHITKVGIGKAL